jgi:nicotinate-nucleotide adenylyltransferase
MLGIFGGTFDPIHFGHIKPALELLQRLPLDEIRFIPCRLPPHRPIPGASAQQRWHMVTTVVKHQPGLRADDRELRRHGPSYTVDTLLDLRTEIGSQHPMCLILGTDAYCTLPTWHRWKEIPALVHIIIMTRPGSALPSEGQAAALLGQLRVQDPDILRHAPHGRILTCSITPWDISSSAIRACIQAGEIPRYMLPGAVWAYIKRHRLYGATT